MAFFLVGFLVFGIPILIYLYIEYIRIRRDDYYEQ